MFGIKSVSFGPSTSKAALEGTYGIDAQGNQNHIEELLLIFLMEVLWVG